MKKIDINFKNLNNIKERFYIKDIQKFLTYHFEHPNDTVVIIDGLYGTGKTTLMQQLAQVYKNNLEFKDKIAFYDIEPNDTMEDVYKELEKLEYKIYCLHDITNVADFVDFSARLANSYARFYGRGIILTGDNSADFSFASRSLFDRKIVFSTNYFPYIEAKQILNFDIDDYVKYGGLTDKNLIKNYDDFKQYLDKYIIDNIIISAKKPVYDNNTIKEIHDDKLDEVKIIIYEMLNTYCGFLDKNLLLRNLKKVNYDVDKLSILNSNYIRFVYKNNNEKIKNKQFLDTLKNIIKQIDDYTIYWLVKDLHTLFSELDMRLLGDIEVDSFHFKRKHQNFWSKILYNCWVPRYKKQYNLITPFIRYFLLLKKLDYIDNDNFKYNLNFELTDIFKNKLKNHLIENIKLSIFKDTIIYDILKTLKYVKYEYYSEDYGTYKQERYKIKKMEFTKNHSSLNILDFFVADYKQEIYYLFKIVNSNIVKVDDLIDKNLIKSLNWYFSKKQKIIILYKDQNFIDKENNFIYLNIDYFLTNFNEKENLEFILENSK